MKAIGWLLAVGLVVGATSSDDEAGNPKKASGNSKQNAKREPKAPAPVEKAEQEFGEQSAESFSGTISINGKTRRFNKRADYEKALKQLGSRGGVFGSREAGPTNFRGVINDNGRVLEFNDPAAWQKAQREMMRSVRDRMRSGFAPPADPFEALSAERETGLVISIPLPEEAKALRKHFDELSEGKIAGASLSRDVKAAMDPGEMNLEFFDASDAAVLAKLAESAIDAARRKQEPEVGPDSVVATITDAETARMVREGLEKLLRRSGRAGAKAESPARLQATADAIVLRVDDPAAVARIKKSLEKKRA